MQDDRQKKSVISEHPELHYATLVTAAALVSNRRPAPSVSRPKRKFNVVLLTIIAASCPMSFHVGAIIVRMMSAASSNSIANASQRASLTWICSV